MRRIVPRPARRWVRDTFAPRPLRPPSRQEQRVQATVDRLRGRVPLESLPSFAGDSLISWHNPEFLDDPAFIRAVDLAVERASWSPAVDVRWRIHVLLWAAARAATMEGDFVECGVNRGGFARAVVDRVDLAALGKTFYLMDTFNGIVEDYLTPEERANGVTRDTYRQFTPCFEVVPEAFRSFPNVVLVRGPIPDTLPQAVPEKVAFLSIDMNVVLPEIAAAEHFWPRLVPGAIVVLDDYGHKTHIPQKHAFDVFAREHGVEVLMLPTGQGLMVKP